MKGVKQRRLMSKGSICPFVFTFPLNEAVCSLGPVIVLLLFAPAHLFLRTQRHLQDLTTMLESCSTRGVRPIKYMMVRGSRSWGTQQGEAEASGFSLLYRGRIWPGSRSKTALQPQKTYFISFLETMLSHKPQMVILHLTFYLCALDNKWWSRCRSEKQHHQSRFSIIWMKVWWQLWGCLLMLPDHTGLFSVLLRVSYEDWYNSHICAVKLRFVP